MVPQLGPPQCRWYKTSCQTKCRYRSDEAQAVRRGMTIRQMMPLRYMPPGILPAVEVRHNARAGRVPRLVDGHTTHATSAKGSTPMRLRPTRWARPLLAALAVTGLTLLAAPAASAAPEPTLTLDSYTIDTANDKVTLQISGTNFDGLTSGAYVAAWDPATTDQADLSAKNFANSWTEVPPGTGIVDGELTMPVTFSIAALQSEFEAAMDAGITPVLEVISWRAHGNLTDDSYLASLTVDFTEAEWESLGITFPAQPTDPPETTEPEPTTESPSDSSEPTATSTEEPTTDPVTEESTTEESTKKTTSEPEVKDESIEIRCEVETIPASPGTPNLSWGIKSSFIAYLGTAAANGTITPSNGAARSGSGFTWGTGSGVLEPGATVSFPGSVHLTAHDGVLDLTLSNLRVSASSATAGTLIADISSQDMSGNDASGTNVNLASLTFSQLADGRANASATITADGAVAFSGFYEAGDELDPLTITMAGAHPASEVERCYDADGNAVDADGNPATEEMAKTGVNTMGMTLFGGAAAAMGVMLLLTGRRFAAARKH